jgi:Cu/Ag efflux protein CusF
MATGKRLGEIAILLVGMPAVVGLGLWGSVQLLVLGGILRAPIREPPPAPQQLEGRIVKLDQAKHEITLEHRPPGGAVVATNSPADPYKLEYDPSFKYLKAGDQVDFTAEQIGGIWTITHIQKK